jgi:uncharacterized RmlC-like cupin family protein
MPDQPKPEVVAVRTGVGIDSRQKIPYFVGVSEATTGARGLSLQYVIIPPGGAAVPHIHQGYETAIYVLSGRVETTYGPGLRKSVVSGPGEFLYIASDVPHQARNLSDTEPAVGIVARNDANEQERVQAGGTSYGDSARYYSGKTRASLRFLGSCPLRCRAFGEGRARLSAL